MTRNDIGFSIGHARAIVSGRAIWIAAFIAFGLTVGFAMLAGAMLVKMAVCA